MTVLTSSPRRAKSADRMEGAMRYMLACQGACSCGAVHTAAPLLVRWRSGFAAGSCRSFCLSASVSVCVLFAVPFGFGLVGGIAVHGVADGATVRFLPRQTEPRFVRRP